MLISFVASTVYRFGSVLRKPNGNFNLTPTVLCDCFLRRNVSFALDMEFDTCRRAIALFNEGVELSLRVGNSTEWIPIAFYFVMDPNIGDRGIDFSSNTSGSLLVRGYQFEQFEVPAGDPTVFGVQVCGLVGPVQFRWLQTSRYNGNGEFRDLWSLDDVAINYQDDTGEQIQLLKESFSTELK